MKIGVVIITGMVHLSLLTACNSVKKISPEQALKYKHGLIVVTTNSNQTFEFTNYNVIQDTLYGYQSDSLLSKICVHDIQTVKAKKPSPAIPIIILSAMVGFLLFFWYLESSVGGYGT